MVLIMMILKAAVNQAAAGGIKENKEIKSQDNGSGCTIWQWSGGKIDE